MNRLITSTIEWRATMLRVLVTAFLVMVATLGAQAEEQRAATLWKNPQCGCCQAYADYLDENGFTVTVRPTHDLSPIKREHGVPEDLEGCHTMVIDGYVVEGHVPLATLDRLLTERPAITGLSLPGMPMGSPGMSGAKTEPFTVYQFGPDGSSVFNVE